MIDSQDRRRLEAYALRIYYEQIAIVEAMTQEEWTTQWLNSELQYMPKDVWLSYLKECALYEGKKLTFIHVDIRHAA